MQEARRLKSRGSAFHTSPGKKKKKLATPYLKGKNLDVVVYSCHPGNRRLKWEHHRPS
jgi:hypothetical protein